MLVRRGKASDHQVGRTAPEERGSETLRAKTDGLEGVALEIAEALQPRNGRGTAKKCPVVSRLMATCVLAHTAEEKLVNPLVPGPKCFKTIV